MHHKSKRQHLTLWFVLQLLSWAAVCVGILLLVTGCKSGEPDDTPSPVPVVMDESIAPCRCGERPWLGHSE